MQGRNEPPAKPWVIRGLGLGLAALLLACAGSFAAMMYLHPEVWRDFRGIEDPNAPEVVLGGVSYQSPRRLPDPVNERPGNPSAGFATDDALVFPRVAPETGDYDLYVSFLRGRVWSDPEPLVETNTDANELSPSLSRNGRYLLFHSNRAGGFGGHDLYVSVRSGKTWGPAFNLGPAINSEFDEMDPHLSPDEADLYFSSNRPKTAVPEDQRRKLWDETLLANRPGDPDIFLAAGVDLPDREDPLRDPDFRRRLITQLGGRPATEDAVITALDWIVQNQEPEGYWDADKLTGDGDNARPHKKVSAKGQKTTASDASATALAALCFLGWGEKHTVEGPYRKPLLAAMDWLAREALQRKGRFAEEGGMYRQAIITLTLAEAYAATHDEMLREPARLCAEVIIAAQDPELGGWRYKPKPEKGDTSVTGWQITALKRARAAGITVPNIVFERAAKWLDHVAGPEEKGTYGYQDVKANRTLTAVGMFLRQMLGARADERRQQASARFIVTDLPDSKAQTDLYFWYYGFLALYQQQGPCWEAWNAKVRDELLARQVKDGPFAGTWTDVRWMSNIDRVTTTALATLSLEVYYRYLPMYDFEGVDVVALKKTAATMRAAKVVRPDTLVPLAARHVAALSSPAADRTPAFTRHGDLVFFSSDRAGGHGGFDLYGALVRQDGFLPVENLGETINSTRDDFGPTLSEDGYWMIFSSDRQLQGRTDRLLYEARSFDVAAKVNQWAAFLALLNRLRWWLTAAALGLVAGMMLLVWYLRVGRYSEAGLKAKCHVASGLVHAALLFFFSIWMIKLAVNEQLGGADHEELVVGQDTLATERLALELRENLAKIETPTAPLRIDSPTPSMDVPQVIPVRHSDIPSMASEQFEIKRPPLEVEVRRVVPNTQTSTPTPVMAAAPIPIVELSLETELETAPERPVFDKTPKPEVDPVVRNTDFAAKEWVERPPVKPDTAPQEVVESIVPLPEGLLALAKPSPAADPLPSPAPRLYGTEDLLSAQTPEVELGLEVALEAPTVAPSPYVFRDTSKRTVELIEQLGGSDQTERAVNLALEWFNRTQEEDGHWDCAKQGGEKGHDVAATGASMLCYFGWGAKHTEDGPHREKITKAINWLVASLDEKGGLAGGNMYDQGIGTMALAEAYGLTKDPALLEPLQRAVDYILNAQHPTEGGWRYRPGEAKGDLSVTGWQVMALISARMAGAKVPEERIDLAKSFLNSVSSGKAAGEYAYQKEGRPSMCMTAVGMFCQQLLGRPPHDPRQMASAQYLVDGMPNAKQRDYYYWYYGTVALYQHQGPSWETWNEAMKDLLVRSQVRGGNEEGSWEPDGRWTRGRGGRIIATAFSTLSLEVYYRYLPLYNTSGGAAPRRKGQ